MHYSVVFVLSLSLFNSKCSCTDFEAFILEGQDCVLPCSGRARVRVRVLEWTRLDQDGELLVVRKGKVLHGYEHPDYTNRVQLLDPQLQRGDLSVILKNVTLKDSGTYICLSLYEDKQEISQFIRLNVTERERDTSIWTNTELTPRRNCGLVFGLSLGLAGIIAVAFVLDRYANVKLCKRLQLFLFRHCPSEKSRDRFRCDSESSSTTTSSTVSDSSTKALIHPDKKHLPDILRNSCPTLEPLPPFTHPLLPSSSPSSTLSRSSSDPGLSGSDPDIDSKSPIPHRSSPDVCALA